MKKQAKFSRILAVLCIISIFFCSLGLQLFAAQDEQQSKAENIMPIEHKVLDLSDFTGQDEYAVSGTDYYAQVSSQPMDGYMIAGIYRLFGTPIINIGGRDRGVHVDVQGTSLRFLYVDNRGTGDIRYTHLTQITSEEAGCQLLFTDVSIKVGVQFVSDITATGEVDIRVTINVGDIYEKIVIVEDVLASNLTCSIYVNPYNGSVATLKTIEKKEYLNFYDFGLREDCTLTNDYRTLSAGSGILNRVVIDGVYNLSGAASIQFGQKNGMRLQMHVHDFGLACQFLDAAQNSYAPDGQYVWYPKDIGCDLVGKDVRIKVQFIINNYDEAAQTGDLVIQIQIGPSWIKEIRVDNVSEIQRLTKTVTIGGSGATVILRMPNPTGIEITPADFGVADGTYQYQETQADTVEGYEVLDLEAFLGTDSYTLEQGQNKLFSAGSGTMDGVVIDGIYHMSMNPALHFGGSMLYEGLQIQRTVKGTVFQFINGYNCGVLNYVEFTTEETGGLYDKDVRIKIGYDFISTDEAAGTADVNISITVGDLETKVLSLKGAKLSCLQRTMCAIAPDASLTLKTAVPKVFATSGEWKNSYTPSASTLTLNGKVFSADVQFFGTGAEVRVGGTDANVWSGLRFTRKSDSRFALSDAYGLKETLLSTEVAALTSTNEKFNLKISFAYVDADNDSKVDDVQYGIWFNNKLYDDTYFYSYDCANLLGNHMLVYCPNVHSFVKISTEYHTTPDVNAPYILEDFGLKTQNYNIHTGLRGNSYAKEVGIIGTMASTITGKVAITGDGSITLFGAKSNVWFGLRFSMVNGELAMQHTMPGVADMDIRYQDIQEGETFTFTISEEKLDLDLDGNLDDVRLGVWVNDALYQERYYYLLDYTDITRAALLYVGTQETSGVTVYPSVPVQAYDLTADENGYLISGAGAMTANNVAVENGDILDKPGDYIVRCSEKGSYVKYVALYEPGDAHADEEMNVLDLVAAKKASKGIGLATKAGENAADTDANNTVNDKDCDNIRRYLLGEIDEFERIDVLTHEKDQMPIAGFFGPYRGEDISRNQKYDYITDDIFSLIKEMGVNLIQSANMYTHSNMADIQDALALAEKYGLGMYVYDTRYNQTLSSAQLAGYMKDFAKYNAFKGIFVVDEPFTPITGLYEPGKMMSEYVDKTKMLNSYCNTLGYINIGPMNAGGDANRYKQHVAEILAPDAKVASWDYYVFDRVTNSQAYANPVDYFRSMSIMRDMAKERNIPFWGFIQAGSRWKGYDTQTNNCTPSEAEMWWNVNTSLAYGVKGIQYFTLIQPVEFSYEGSDGYDYGRNGLIGANGVPTQWYGYAKDANTQIAAVDEYLLYAENKGVLAIGRAAQADTGITQTTHGNLLTGVEAADGALIGVFEYQGKTAYYVVNYDTYDTDSVDATYQGDAAADEITLTFGESQNYSVVSTQLASQNTQSSGKTCTLSLKNGGAALIIMNN